MTLIKNVNIIRSGSQGSSGLVTRVASHLPSIIVSQPQSIVVARSITTGAFALSQGSTPTVAKTANTSLSPISQATSASIATSVTLGGSILLMHFDGTNGSTTFTDVYGHTFTANGAAALSTSQAKFGTASLQPGVGYAKCSTSDSAFGLPGDFTVECFCYPASGLSPSLFGIVWTALSGGWEIYNASAKNGPWNFRKIGTGDLVTGSATMTNNAWNHIAVVRSGSTIKLYINGTLDASGTNSSTFSQAGLQIGTCESSGQFSGYIDEFRISKVARYTSNFTPTSSAFTS